MPIDFELSKQQNDLKHLGRELAQDFAARALQNDHERSLPLENFAQLRALASMASPCRRRWAASEPARLADRLRRGAGAGRHLLRTCFQRAPQLHRRYRPPAGDPAGAEEAGRPARRRGGPDVHIGLRAGLVQPDAGRVCPQRPGAHRVRWISAVRQEVLRLDVRGERATTRICTRIPEHDPNPAAAIAPLVPTRNWRWERRSSESPGTRSSPAACTPCSVTRGWRSSSATRRRHRSRRRTPTARPG
jgi:hypothetical protein